MNRDIVTINRAPVLTLWTAVVAEHLGYDRDTALTLGKAVAGLNAQAKGRRIGIFIDTFDPTGIEDRKIGSGEEFRVHVCGRAVPARNTEHGLRAVVDDTPIDPKKVERYLRSKFGESLEAVRRAMEELAATFDPEELEDTAYGLYETFRPEVAPGRAGWGQRGELNLELIRSLGGRSGRASFGRRTSIHWATGS